MQLCPLVLPPGVPDAGPTTHNLTHYQAIRAHRSMTFYRHPQHSQRSAPRYQQVCANILPNVHRTFKPNIFIKIRMQSLKPCHTLPDWYNGQNWTTKYLCLLLFGRWMEQNILPLVNEHAMDMQIHRMLSVEKTDINGFQWTLFGFHLFRQSAKMWQGLNTM